MPYFFTPNGPVTQVALLQGHSVTGLFNKRRILKKVKEYFVNTRPETGLQGIKLLHDIAPCHRASVVTDFLKNEKVKILPHPPYSPELAPLLFIAPL